MERGGEWELGVVWFWVVGVLGVMGGDGGGGSACLVFWGTEKSGTGADAPTAPGGVMGTGAAGFKVTAAAPPPPPSPPTLSQALSCGTHSYTLIHTHRLTHTHTH